MNYKERLKQYLEEDTIYSEYKSGKCDMSDFDEFCIKHCKDIECLLNEVQKQKEVIDKAIKLHNEFATKNALLCFETDVLLQFMNDLLDILKEVE